MAPFFTPAGEPPPIWPVLLVLPSFSSSASILCIDLTMKLLSNLLYLHALSLSLFAGDQPQWGERWSRNMLSAEKGLPTSFDPKSGTNIRWVAKLGTETHSTPIISGERVYIGTNNGEPRDPKHNGDRGVLMCFDEQDGHLLWQLVVPKREEDPYFDWP